MQKLTLEITDCVTIMDMGCVTVTGRELCNNYIYGLCKLMDMGSKTIMAMGHVKDAGHGLYNSYWKWAV